MIQDRLSVEKALAFLDTLAKRHELFRDIERSIQRQLNQDNGISIRFMDDHLYEPMMDMLDHILGDQIASYFFHEARFMPPDGGRIIEPDGREFMIKTIDDVRAYVFRDEVN